MSGPRAIAKVPDFFILSVGIKLTSSVRLSVFWVCFRRQCVRQNLKRETVPDLRRTRRSKIKIEVASPRHHALCTCTCLIMNEIAAASSSCTSVL